MSLDPIAAALAGICLSLGAQVFAEASKPASPPDLKAQFTAHGPGLTVGNPRKLILDSPGYGLERCLRECFEGTHGPCVAATFHLGNECKLFSTYRGIKKSVVADKVAYIKK